MVLNMACKISLNEISRRIQFKTYQGQPSAVIGGSTSEYAYVLSDTVPQGHFWSVFFASAIILGGAATAINRAGLWLVKPGKLPVNNLQPYANNLDFFQGATALAVNGPPVGPQAIRVDELNDGVTTDQYNARAERVLIRARKLLVPGGFTLMCYGGAYGNGNGGNVGEQYQLQIAFVDFKETETPEVDF